MVGTDIGQLLLTLSRNYRPREDRGRLSAVNPTAAETCALLALVVRAMVRDRDAVTVEPVAGLNNRIVFVIRVADEEIGKLIGKHGRTARSLRQILGCISSENGADFRLNLDNRSQHHSIE